MQYTFLNVKKTLKFVMQIKVSFMCVNKIRFTKLRRVITASHIGQHIKLSLRKGIYATRKPPFIFAVQVTLYPAQTMHNA